MPMLLTLQQMSSSIAMGKDSPLDVLLAGRWSIQFINYSLI